MAGAFGLSFEQAPPVSVPYRFFLAAPVFGVLAGLLLVVEGGDALASRWTPQALALTHLLALGFMLQAMCGALLQFMPVAVGANVWRPAWVAAAVQALLLAGTLMLTGGWLFAWPALWQAAAPLLLLAGLGFAAVVSWGLWRTPATGMTLWTLRAAVGGLAVTVALGAALVATVALGLPLPLLRLTDVHLAWGLGGWSLMLLAGVSYHVVPMFQLTQAYPPRYTRAFAPLLLALLLGWSAQLWFNLGPVATALALLLLALAAGHGAITLWLQHTRKRKIHDATSRHFRLAMLSLLAFCTLGAACAVWPPLGTDPRTAVAQGVLALVGVFTPAISGMMVKILPFLNWLHLQRLGVPTAGVPNMKQMIPAAGLAGQGRLQGWALALLLAAVAGHRWRGRLAPPWRPLTRGWVGTCSARHAAMSVSASGCWR
ncbi:conserved membrane hypothetical protein [Rubrivivax sp. A210]|uniref:hypothetical protein n=1 Tax=Rubrivivax sp. A210 TaxID=2772301 RepID=UPI00191AD113|nr:hypothetical protein [Rubrivivax sp. A210]CAD5374304.1 conserved membrane hypothetical protein [Rubrivivax sp. A210]